MIVKLANAGVDKAATGAVKATKEMAEKGFDISEIIGKLVGIAKHPATTHAGAATAGAAAGAVGGHALGSASMKKEMMKTWVPGAAAAGLLGGAGVVAASKKRDK